MLMLSMYTYCTNSGNCLVLDTSWSTYLSVSIQPSRVGVSCTPSRMHGKTTKALGCLHGEHTMGCFPFLFTGVLEVPTFGSLYFMPDSGFPVMYSICTYSYCVDPIIGYSLGLSDSVLSLSPPFVLWTTLALAGCCAFPVANGS
jgi:hypothetical protein